MMEMRKRGRPTNAERARRSAMATGSMAEHGQIVVKEMSDEELLSDIQFRFSLVADMARAVVAGDIKALIVSGAQGMSKTFTIEGVLENAVDQENKKVEIVKGKMTAIQFYKILWRNRTKNDIILLDDVNIFDDETSISIAKAAFDTSPTRRISWMSETNALKEDDIPTTFVYNGGAIFITNTDMQGVVDSGVGKLVPHMKALIDRAAYLDLNLHQPRPKMVWIRYITETFKMLEASPFDRSPEEVQVVLNFMDENRESMRDLSLRAAQKIAHYQKINPLNWKRVTEMMMMKK
jgi:hypothetical protein